MNGAPDLLVEVLARATRSRDRGVKKERYRAARVPEYWIVDGDQHLVEQFVLERKGYELLGKCHEEIFLRGLSGVRVDLTKVW